MALRLFSICFLVALYMDGANAATDENWTEGFGQGWHEAGVTHGPGNSIKIGCEAGSSQPGSISFELIGKAPTPHSEVLVSFDSERPFAVQVDDGGRIRPDCRACLATFQDLIERMKKHAKIWVRFEHGPDSTFTLKGAAKAIGDCNPGWPTTSTGF